MKLFLVCYYVVFFSVASFANSSISEIRNTPFKGEKKIYVNQDQIIIQDNKIFAQIGSEWQQVDRVESSSKGMTVAFMRWTCPKCNYDNNPLNEIHCRKCGWAAHHEG